MKTLLILCLALSLTACAAKQQPNVDAAHVAEQTQTEEASKPSVGKKILQVFGKILGGAGQGLQDGAARRQNYTCRNTYSNNYECEKD